MDRDRKDILTPWLNVALAVSILVVSVIAIDRFSREDRFSIISSLQDRNLAIERAKQEGRTEYSFTTGFIPGVGAPPAPSESSNKFEVIEKPAKN